MSTSSRIVSQNILLNHDFSQGVTHWIPNDCDFNKVSDKDGTYAKTTRRNNYWSCLEQDIKDRVLEGHRYKASARVRIRGSPSDRVDAKLNLKYRNRKEYLDIYRFEKTISDGEWRELQGEFTMGSTDADKILFYIFKPQPGVELHIQWAKLIDLDANTNETPITNGGADGNMTPITKSNQMRDNRQSCCNFIINCGSAGEPGNSGPGCSSVGGFLRGFLCC